MDRIWQWAWDRYGARFTWAGGVIAFLVSLPIYLTFVSFPIVAFEKSGRYLAAAAATSVAALVLAGIMVLPDRRWARPAEQWAAGREVDRTTALEGTYIFSRRASSRTVWAAAVWAAGLSVVVGAIAGASWLRSTFVRTRSTNYASRVFGDPCGGEAHGLRDALGQTCSNGFLEFATHQRDFDLDPQGGA